MYLFKVKQLSDEWWAVRRGVPTASAFDKIITPAKGELSKQADDYIAELIAEIACQTPAYFTQQGRPVNSYAIENGRDMEPEARKWLAFDAGLDVAEVGFCMTEDLLLGCSPDGLLGLECEDEPAGEWNGFPFYRAKASSTLELKCPLLKTHTSYLMEGGLPTAYKPQCHGQLLVCGTEACEFVSYSPDLEPLRVQVKPDDYTTKMRAALDAFLKKYQAAAERILPRGKLPRRAA